MTGEQVAQQSTGGVFSALTSSVTAVTNFIGVTKPPPPPKRARPNPKAVNGIDDNSFAQNCMQDRDPGTFGRGGTKVDVPDNPAGFLIR